MASLRILRLIRWFGRSRRLQPQPLKDLLREQGFATVPLLGSEALAELVQGFDSLGFDGGTGMFRSVAEGTREQARLVDQAIAAVVGPPLAALLPDYAPVFCGFIMKWPGAERLEYHQDWTCCDERRKRSFLAWVPLVDVDESNGALEVVPGSHRWSNGIRGPVAQSPTDVYQVEFAAQSRPVPLKAGEAIISDTALVHGSGPNGSSSPRLALTVLLGPVDEPILHFRPDEGVAGFHVDRAFFTNAEFETCPVGYERVTAWGPAVAAADFKVPLGLASRTR